jgi:hypothetical protein
MTGFKPRTAEFCCGNLGFGNLVTGPPPRRHVPRTAEVTSPTWRPIWSRFEHGSQACRSKQLFIFGYIYVLMYRALQKLAHLKHFYL